MTVNTYYLLFVLIGFPCFLTAQSGNPIPKPQNTEVQKSLQYQAAPLKFTESFETNSQKKNEKHNAINEELQENQTSNSSELSFYNEYTELRNSYLRNDGRIDNAEQKKLNGLVSESLKLAPESFYSKYIALRQNRNNATAFSFLKNIDNSSVQPGLLAAEQSWLAERSADKANLNKSITAYFNAGMFSPLQLKMAEWMLLSVPEDGLIITNGEFDTYPLWFQNRNHNVTIISLAMMEDKDWLTKKLNAWDPSLKINKSVDSIQQLIELLKKSRKPVFISFSISKKILVPNAANLYPVGALAQLSETVIQNLPLLQKFYFDPRFLAELEKKQTSNDPFNKVLANLYPGLGVLKSHGLANQTDQIIQLEKLLKGITGKSFAQ